VTEREVPTRDRRGRPGVVDLTAYPVRDRMRMRGQAQSLARVEVCQNHVEEYQEAYKGWLEALKEQREREGST
jgi:hypothetical protein